MTNTNTKRQVASSTSNKRWILINKRSKVFRTARTTRAAARTAKRPTEWIYDSINKKFVR